AGDVVARALQEQAQAHLAARRVRPGVDIGLKYRDTEAESSRAQARKAALHFVSTRISIFRVGLLDGCVCNRLDC
ncbi:hypothetical protein, partial [Burkholderia sp. BCC1638]|uniref:hypothetical protein n=1 Tax=Burkholderia sp. BCC1638 TaxID=2681391 RepID=UPI00158E7E38